MWEGVGPASAGRGVSGCIANICTGLYVPCAPPWEQHGHMYHLWSSFMADQSISVKDVSYFFSYRERCFTSESGFCLQYNLESMPPTSKSQTDGGAEKLKN